MTRAQSDCHATGGEGEREREREISLVEREDREEGPRHLCRSP